MIRLTLALATSALLGIAIGAAAADSGAPIGGVAAQALTGAPPTRAGGDTYTPKQALGRAHTLGIPLPAGGNFNGVKWVNGGAAIPASAIESVVEYNAACQWLRAWRDGREAALAVDVLQRLPQWPFERGTESGAFLARVAGEVAAGGGETAGEMLADCDRSHAEETKYARSQGLTPST